MTGNGPFKKLLQSFNLFLNSKHIVLFLCWKWIVYWLEHLKASMPNPVSVVNWIDLRICAFVHKSALT